MSLAYTGRLPPSAALAKSDDSARVTRQVKTKVASARKPKGQSKKPFAPAKKPSALHAETFSASALTRKKEQKKLAAGNSFPLPTERLKFRFWELDDFAIAKQLWGDDRVTEQLGGPFSVLPLGDLRKRARLKGASDEQMAEVEAANDLEKKEKLVYLISECELAQAHLHAELSPCGAVQELRDQAVQLRLDAEIARQIEHGVQLYPAFLQDPIPEMLTPGAGNVGCVGLRKKDVSTLAEEVECTFGPGIAAAYEIAFHIRPPYWRRGLATEAASAVLNHAFMKLKADMVIASCDRDNFAAQQLLRKLGFQYVGVDMFSELPTATDERIEQPKQTLPEGERRPQSRPQSTSSRRSINTPLLALELAAEPEPEPELNSGLGLAGMFGWGRKRPTYVMLRSEHADRIDAQNAFPAVEGLFETMVGIGEGSEFYLRRQIREEGWVLRDLQRRVQRAGIPAESAAYQQAMAADDPHEAIVQLLVDNSLYHTKVQIMQVVTNATNAMCSQLCMHLKTKLLDGDINNRHRTLMIVEACTAIPQAALFRKQLREHCLEAISKMVDFKGEAGRQTELEAIMHNHATLVQKGIAFQPKDEVEAFIVSTPEDIFAAMDKDGDGEASKEEFAEAMRSGGKNISDEEIDRIFKQLDTDGGGTLSSTNDAQVQVGGETTHSGMWERGVVVDVGPAFITVQLHQDKNAAVAPQRTLSDLGTLSGSPRPEPPAPPPSRRVQIPWVELHELDDGVDPAVLMSSRMRLVSPETLAEEKQADNERAALLRAKREKEAREAAARGDSLTRMAKSMWAQKSKGERKTAEAAQNDRWDQGTNIDAFIKKHDIRIKMDSSSAAEQPKEKVKQAAMLLGARALKHK